MPAPQREGVLVLGEDFEPLFLPPLAVLINSGGVGQLPSHLVKGTRHLFPSPALVLGAEPA